MRGTHRGHAWPGTTDCTDPALRRRSRVRDPSRRIRGVDCGDAGEALRLARAVDHQGRFERAGDRDVDAVRSGPLRTARPRGRRMAGAGYCGGSRSTGASTRPIGGRRLDARPVLGPCSARQDGLTRDKKTAADELRRAARCRRAVSPAPAQAAEPGRLRAPPPCCRPITGGGDSAQRPPGRDPTGRAKPAPARGPPSSRSMPVGPGSNSSCSATASGSSP